MKQMFLNRHRTQNELYMCFIPNWVSRCSLLHSDLLQSVLEDLVSLINGDTPNKGLSVVWICI